jgi:hypothetical protein
MSTTTAQARPDASDGNWTAGLLAGLAGSLVMAGLMLAMNAGVLAVAIPSLYTLAPPANVPLGVVVHLVHGAMLGIAFVGISRVLDVESARALLGLGVAWGVVTWVGLAALLMPVWLGAVGSPASPPFPNFAPPSLLWHVVYGLVLGGVFAVVREHV